MPRKNDEPVQKPMGLSIEWLLDRADLSQAEEIKSFVKRQDWNGLKAWVRRNAAPAVSEAFEARAWPPPPAIHHGAPAVTMADVVRGKPLWRDAYLVEAERIEQERQQKIRDEYEMVPIPKEEF
jgi:hypothetical protein